MGVNSQQCRLSSIIVSGERREVGVAILLSAKKKTLGSHQIKNQQAKGFSMAVKRPLIPRGKQIS